MAKSIPIDVTDKLRAAGHLSGEHWNDEDRVYDLEGQMVKVKTYHETHALPVRSPTGLLVTSSIDVLRVWGSVVGEDGKAVIREDGTPAVYGFGRHITLHHETDVDVPKEAEMLRFQCVEETLRAHRHHMHLRALTGAARHAVRIVGVSDIRQIGGRPSPVALPAP